MEAKIFAIDGRNKLANSIADFHKMLFNTQLQVGSIKIDKFSDGEYSPIFQESVRGDKVYLLCSANTPENIIKLNLAIDAAKRASADEVIALCPYFPYSRQDRKEGIRGAIGARVMANMLISNGLDRIITIDLHASQIQGFFNIPVDHIEGHSIFFKHIKEQIEMGAIKNPLLCSPDAGGMKRVEDFIKRLNVPAVSIYKHREKPNEIAKMQLMGNVTGMDVIIIDDMIDTGGTLKKAAQLVMDSGAKSVRAIATHAVLSGNGLSNLASSPLNQVIFSDTLPTLDNIMIEDEDAIDAIRYAGQLGDLSIVTISCAPVIAKVINAINNGLSSEKLQEDKLLTV